MCGIAGIVAPPHETVERYEVAEMCSTLIHRGPDDEGIYIKGPVGLGMRRLSIIDLVDGHQPIHNETEDVWIVFNGEIYNYPQLRKDLEGRGHCFYTHSDTEVIVHLYEEMGADCLAKLRGMFAIALYDYRRNSLLLARDRLGKKPLHYAFSNGRLLFGSEIKALLSAEPELASVNPQALLQYFQFGYIPDPATAFARINKLLPGHALESVNGAVRSWQYWDVPAYGVNSPSSEEDCLSELEQRLAEAVRVRLISDVPLGALLSGGLDSSLVVALMARAASGPVKTFSIGFNNPEFDELSHARAVAERFSTDHHELVVEPDVEKTVAFLTSRLEEPFGDSSMVPTYQLCQMARRFVTVALSGDGGDELFAGYDRYRIHLKRKKYDLLPPWMGGYFRRHIFHKLPAGFRGRMLAYNASLPSRERYLDSIAFLPAFDRERSLFTREFLAWTGEHQDPAAGHKDYYDAAPALDTLGRLLYLDTKTYLAGDILTKVDRMSMLNSLEVRGPFLDHILFEWVAQLPSHLKLRMGNQKYILKKLAERVGIPAKVLNRPKQGFAMPLVHWWRKELSDGMLGILTEPRTLQRGYFNGPAVRNLISEHTTGRRDRSAALWLLLIFELWHRNFMEAQGWSANVADQVSGATA
jgi:asparagine synthase (glutamine-hydrolysing)